VGNKKQKLLNNIKIGLGVTLFILALGYVGEQDRQYETRPSVCREWQGEVVCYKP